MKPIIGISSAIFKSEDIIKAGIMHLENMDLVRSPIDYANVVSEVGGIPFIIPTINKKNAEEIVSKIDGLILTGGSDIDPSLFNEKPIETDFEIMKSDIKRDLFEMELIKYAIKLNKPILGVCRGMQLLNVYFSGSIYQELTDNIISDLTHITGLENKRKLAHKVKIKKHSILYKT